MHYIHSNLKQREEAGLLKKDWIYQEAISSLNLQSGGAFMHVLLRKLDREATDALAGIIAFIDSNYNLDLLDKGHDMTVVEFWLNAFKHKAICDLWDASNVVGRFCVCQKLVFRCSFPFSDTIQETLEAELKPHLSTSGKCIYYMV